MSTEWTHVRIPAALKAELEAEADALMRIYQEGRGDLPAEYCERVPIHYVIARAIEGMRSKRERSRTSRRLATRGVSPGRTAGVVATGGGHVNTVRAGGKAGG